MTGWKIANDICCKTTLWSASKLIARWPYFVIVYAISNLSKEISCWQSQFLQRTLYIQYVSLHEFCHFWQFSTQKNEEFSTRPPGSNCSLLSRPLSARGEGTAEFFFSICSANIRILPCTSQSITNVRAVWVVLLVQAYWIDWNERNEIRISDLNLIIIMIIINKWLLGWCLVW